jgi:hypothetical protein
MQKPFEVHVGSMYGAPMGRRSTPMDLIAAASKAHLQRVPASAAITIRAEPIGAGSTVRRLPGNRRLYCVWNDAGANYFRANDRAHAITLLQRSGAKLLRPF